MKNLILTFASICISFVAFQGSANNAGYYTSYDGNKFIFVEGGIEFSVFPDGQFDFVYLGNQGSQVTINTPNVAVNFNSGYNYDAYIQYDSYGAVIQIEDTPIYYDQYGRIVRAGDVTIRYNNRRLVQVGGLYIHYNPYGYYSHYTGYINVYNRHYVYRPWHVYYAVPFNAYCVVYMTPYRRFYTPVRYSYFYHKKHYKKGLAYSNGRRDFYRPGTRMHHRDGRVSPNNNFKPSGRNSSASSMTYQRDDNVIRNNFNSRVNNNVQRGTPKSSTASRTDYAQRGNPNANSSSNVNRTVRGATTANSRVENSPQRGKPNNSTTAKNERSQRPAININSRVAQNDRVQRATSNSSTTVKNERSQRPAATASKPMVSRKSNTSRQSVARPAASQTRNTQANRTTTSKQSNTTSRASGSTRNSGNRGGRG